MKDSAKKKRQLIEELQSLRERISEVETSQIELRINDKALPSNDELLSAIINSSHDAVIILDPEGKISFWNEAGEKLFGYSEEEALHRSMYKLLMPESFYTDFLKSFKSYQKTGKGQQIGTTMERVAIRKDRTELPVEISITPVQWQSRWYTTAIIKDITGRKQAEEGLRNERDYLEKLHHSLGDAVFTVDLPGRMITFANRSVFTIFGFEPAECLGKSTEMFFPDRQSFLEFGARLQNGIENDDETLHTEATFKSKAGELIPCDITISFIRTNGEIRQVISIVHDISDRKQAETKLQNAHDELEQKVQERTAELENINARLLNEIDERKQAEEMIRRISTEQKIILDNVPAAIWYKDLENNILRVNKAGANDVGMTVEEIEGQHVSTLFPEEAEHYYDDDQEVIKTGEAKLGIIEQLQTSSGEKRWVQTDKIPSRNLQGDITGIIAFVQDITVRKKAEEDLRESEERYRRLVKNAPDIIYRHWIAPESGFEFISEAVTDIAGYTPDEFYADPELGTMIIHPVDRVALADMLKGQLPASPHEVRWLHKDGHTVWVEDRFTQITDSEGNLIAIEGITRDITATKLAQEKLAESERTLRHIHEHAIEGVFRSSVDGTILYANEAMAKMFGYDRVEDFMATNMVDHYHEPAGRDEVIKTYEKLRELQGFKLRMVHKNGSDIWVLVNSRAISDDDGNILWFEGFLSDITKRKQAEETVRESEERYRQLFSTVADAIVIFDGHTRRFVDANQRALELYGHTRDEFLQLTQLDLSAEPEVSDSEIREVLAGYRKHASLSYQKKKDGTVFPVEISTSVFTLDGREVICAVIRDITERKQAEDELRESQATLLESQKVGQIGNYLLDIPGGVWTSSEVLDTILGIDNNHDHTFEGWLAIVHPDWRQVMADYFTHDVIEQRGRFEKDYQIIRINDGVERWVHGKGELSFDDNGNPVSMLGTIQDVTGRKQAQAEIEESHEWLRNLSGHLQSVREEEKGEMAREIHDELGQRLTALQLDLAWLKRRLPDKSERFEKKMESMNDLLKSTSQLVNKISSSLRPSILDDLGLVPAIEWQIEQFRDTTSIPCNLVISAPHITRDREQCTAIFRILQESLTNVARHADATDVRITLEQTGDGIVLEVVDNGIGISAEDISSSKSVGLVGMRERLYAWGGEFTINGKPGKGTTVLVKIPLTESTDSND